MSTRSSPIVLHVLYVADQRHPWRLAPYERLATRYHTPTTVAVAFGTIDYTVKPQAGKSGVSKQQTHVWCLPDEAAWVLVQATQRRLQQALDALADELRLLGSYAKRLEAAGGIKLATNPLSATAIGASDPDDTESTGYYLNRLVPHIERKDVASHTPKMLHVTRDGRPWSTSHQRDHFVCPADADWQAVEQRIAAATTAAEAWQRLLRGLGTYADALADGRYTSPAAVASLLPLAGLVAARECGETDLDDALLEQLAGAGYTWQSANRTPDGRWHHLVSFRDEALHRNEQIRLRRERLEARVAPAGQLAVVEPAIAAVPMMDAAEARETIDAMRQDLGQIDISLASFRRRALDFAEREGWRALSYAGVAEAINAELGAQYSKSYLSRLLGAAKIERILFGELPMGNSPEVPERVLREIGRAETPEAQRAAWERATTSAGGATPTVSQAREAVQAPTVQRTDIEYIRQARAIITTLEQWAESARPGRIQEAYALAREVRDHERRAALMAEIDQVIDPHAGDRQKLRIARTHLEIATGSGLPTQIRQQVSDARKLLFGISDALASERDELLTQAAAILAELDGREVEAAAAVLTPPQEPVSADVSAVLAYQNDLAEYVAALDEELTEELRHIAALLRKGRRAAAIRALLVLANTLVGHDLTELAETLDDATYEALAAYRRDRVVTLEAEVSA
jgi:hypothetical protein